VVALIVSGSAIAYGRPQGFDDFQKEGRDDFQREDAFAPALSRGAGKLGVICQNQEVSPGVYKFNCAGVNPRDITLSSEHILWLRGANGEAQQLDITVPNYRVEELIRAALKSSKGGSTNVNILLKKPETVYDVQAQEGGNVPGAKPVVNLQYEEVPRPTSVHYPTNQAYNPLSGPIREP